MNFELQMAVDSFIVSSRLPTPSDQQSGKFIGSPELQEMAKLISVAPPDERREAITTLASAMSEFAPFAAGRCAIYFGASVERGADAELSINAVIDQLRQQLSTLSRMIKSAGDKPPESLSAIANKTPEQVETMTSLEFVAQSAVSHLVRSDIARHQLAADKEFTQLLQTVCGFHYGADWVQGVLSITSGELILLFPQEAKGFRVTYKNVGNNFHLFTLIQEVFAPLMGRETTGKEDLYAAARGEIQITQKMSDNAIWDYHQYAACKGKPSPTHYVWGEGSPVDIPKLDGQTIVLANPLTIKRGWAGGFFGPQLKQSPPRVDIVGTLTADEVQSWLERARQATVG